MGRLIDADVLIEELKLKSENTMNDIEHRALNRAINTVKRQPIAYDVEKVVEELESKKEKYYKDFELATDTLDIMCYGNMSNVYGHAIEIVRKGGAE